jgi:hypothetical protein
MTMEKEIPGVLRPTGGTKKFRRNCRLVAEKDAIAATDRDGNTRRFPLDGSEAAPAEMITYLGKDPFVIVDRTGKGLITSPFLLWDSSERADFCEVASIEFNGNNVDPAPPLRLNGVQLEEPAWLRRYAVSAPYALAAGVGLAAIGRAFNLPVWLMLPFLPWLIMYPVVRATGYFAPRRIGPSDIRFREEVEAARARKARRPRSKPGPGHS